MREHLATDHYPHPLERDVAELEAELSTLLRGLVWAPGRVLWDDPASINDARLRTMSRFLFERGSRLERELLVEAAYFIPLGESMGVVRMLRDRGVRMRVLTNSLASNDVVAAFAGYSEQREALLEAGVEM